MAKKTVDLKKLGKALEIDINAQSETEYKLIAFDLFSEIIQRTPVDTGRARSNWTMNTNYPVYTESNSTTLPQLSDINVKDFPPVFIANGLPYVAELDEGKRSSQAPTGITLPAIQTVRLKYK
jgi:hypothetical protein